LVEPGDKTQDTRHKGDAVLARIFRLCAQILCFFAQKQISRQSVWTLADWREAACSAPKKRSRKDFLYQSYSVLLTSAPPSCHRPPSELCLNPPKKTFNTSFVYFGWKNHKSKYRSPSVFVISIEPGSLLVVLKMSFMARVSGETGFKTLHRLCTST